MKAKIAKSLRRDATSIVNSIYRLNAPYAIGYGFDPKADGLSIARGMFLNREDDATAWTYYLDLKTEEIHNWK